MGARGERTISTEKGEVRILFTNRAIMSAEQQLGKGILGVMDGFMQGSSGMTELVALLRVSMEAARVEDHSGTRPISNTDALALVDDIGFTAAIAPVMEALAAVISYEADKQGEDGADPNS